MSAFPPAFFEEPQAFTEVTEDELGGHVHGEGCGHEAVPHGDHVDYVNEHGHAHFFSGGKWFRHHKTAADAQAEHEDR